MRQGFRRWRQLCLAARAWLGCAAARRCAPRPACQRRVARQERGEGRGGSTPALWQGFQPPWAATRHSASSCRQPASGPHAPCTRCKESRPWVARVAPCRPPRHAAPRRARTWPACRARPALLPLLRRRPVPRVQSTPAGWRWTHPAARLRSRAAGGTGRAGLLGLGSKHRQVQGGRLAKLAGTEASRGWAGQGGLGWGPDASGQVPKCSAQGPRGRPPPRATGLPRAAGGVPACEARQHGRPAALQVRRQQVCRVDQPAGKEVHCTYACFGASAGSAAAAGLQARASGVPVMAQQLES